MRISLKFNKLKLKKGRKVETTVNDKLVKGEVEEVSKDGLITKIKNASGEIIDTTERLVLVILTFKDFFNALMRLFKIETE